MRRIPSRHRNAPIVTKVPDRGAFKRFSSLLAAAAMLAIGFLYAGHQHFAALRLGYETEKLRNTLTGAKEEQRRLTVQREVATSPARLEQAARQLGMQPMQANQIDPLRRPAEIPQTKPVAQSVAKSVAQTKAAPKTPPTQKQQQPRVR
jgi:cell division protein FtsL